MGFSVVRYQGKQNVNWGIVQGDRVIPIPGTFESLATFLQEGVPNARKIADSDSSGGISIHDLHILSPITRPAQIVCQGLNYGAHRAEAGSTEKPSFNLIFTKAESSICGPNDHVICPDHVRLLDYEIELGLVIGKAITDSVEVTDDNLLDYVAGLVITNDISARDVQIPQDQYYKGKSYRTFCPTGPFLYILDQEDIPQIYNLDLKLWVNGELRQSANTKQLIYRPAETLTELSGLMDVFPGDLIMTGTPSGIAIQLTPELIQKMSETPDKKTEILINNQKDNPRFLKEGDTICCEIKSHNGLIDLGVQKNLIVGSKRH
jgi:2-keto-4-pentenoate hydratase/2-oxohepta-3-ene-1,7-dioic acid hydratase in catechol pathway